MKDGLGRRTIKRIGLAVFRFRLLAHRAHVRRSDGIRYELGGSCQGCASCCEAPGIQVDRLTWYVPLLRRTVLWWHQHVNGFELIETRRRERTFVFRCGHFDPETRRCDSYESRPGMCRDYPRLLLEHANPEFFENCGFRALAVNRIELVRILEQQPLPADKMAKLKKEMYLE